MANRFASTTIGYADGTREKITYKSDRTVKKLIELLERQAWCLNAAKNGIKYAQNSDTDEMRDGNLKLARGHAEDAEALGDRIQSLARKLCK